MSDKARAASLNERQDHQDSDSGGIDRVVPNSVRDSIEKTISTMADEGNEDAERYSKALNEKRERVKQLRGEASDIDDDSSDDSDPDTNVDETDIVDSDNQHQQTSSNQLPDFVKADKALAREWNKLKPNVQREITNIVNRKKEIEAQSQHFQHYKEIDNVIDTGLRKQGILNIDQLQAVPDPATGQLVKPTRASIVSNLLFWVGALGHPDIRTRTNALAALANRYGIDLSQVSQGNQAERWSYNRDAQYNDPPLHINPNSVNANIQQGIAQEFQRYQQQQQYQHEVQQAEVKSKPRIENWAKQKPHFEKVRAKMAQVLTGMLQNGAIDKNADISSPKYLNIAYETAIRLDPSIAEQVNRERKKQLGRRENPNQQQHQQQHKYKNTNNTVRGALKAAFDAAREE